MRLSRYFLPVLKEVPGDAQVGSHQLMLRAGMVSQSLSGIYVWLPLGLRVLDKIARVIREEQQRAGSIEMLMPTIQAADLWEKSGRYASYGEEMLRFKDRHGRDLLYGPTNEEVITQLFSRTVVSYRSLPLSLFHIQWKFRDEVRPRFGVMRAREFLMKDAYSFDLDEVQSRLSYQKMFVSYLRIFRRLGVEVVPVWADTGPIGGDMSHEFVIPTENGESSVFYDKRVLNLPTPSLVDYAAPSEVVASYTRLYARTDDKHDKRIFEAEVDPENRSEVRGIEVGHVFYFGDRYARPLGASVSGADGRERFVHMGSYGIGVSRLVGALIEAFKDERGMRWPMSIAPFHVGLLNLRPNCPVTSTRCEEIYKDLSRLDLDVLYDDLDISVGRKRATMDLLGVPWQVVVGPSGLREGFVEVKDRFTSRVHRLPGEGDIAQSICRVISAQNSRALGAD